jgi:amidohydrolase
MSADLSPQNAPVGTEEEEDAVNRLKEQIMRAVDDNSASLKTLSLKIHANPELGLQEVKTAALLCDYLSQNGFSVERGICELPTSFRAKYGSGKPAIAFIAEYDALPNLGHACGHNIISTAAVGAGVVSKLAADRLGGSIYVVGTPAEEFYGGKVAMAMRGGFDNLDFAMMVHPGWEDRAIHYTFAAQTIEVEFFGKASHASHQPELGINALEAMIQSFVHINSLRQHIKEKARITGIITNGGEAPNIVPAYSAASFTLRAADDAYLEELKQKVVNCFIGAATATGARLEYKWPNGPRNSMRTNFSLAEVFSQNLSLLGRTSKKPDPNDLGGSADMANVSRLVPSIHAWIAITSGIVPHRPEFAVASASETGMRGLIDATKAMSMTAADLLGKPKVRTKIKEEFQSGGDAP